MEGGQNKRRRKGTLESEVTREIDLCSKHGDLRGALSIFNKVTQQGLIKLKQHNYNVILYLCSSAATGTLNPSMASSSDNDEITELALQKGFMIYAHMQQEGVPLNEATFTSVARLAHAKGDGDLAFEMVKRMKASNITPKLRSYGPALYAYCRNKQIEKAFEVDAHMLASGIQPEESELAALLKLSVDGSLEDRVYLLLHRLRASVRVLSPSTMEVVQQWFCSEAASRAGEKQNWEKQPSIDEIKAATEARGGGWHGVGWLGKGKWQVERTTIDEKGSCICCGNQLATIDIDPLETENFAKTVAELACQRETKLNEFKAFQNWLSEKQPYEAIVDGANVGLYQQNFSEGGFSFQQLKAVVTAVQLRSSNKRMPLVILHNRRTQGGAASVSDIDLLKEWMETDVLYATPTGSNDDWYWLYAAVKCKCLLVTNDEMRDHAFQMLGNDFFPKWKERHQVRFTFPRNDVELHMPPLYSIVIQESLHGSWHLPQIGGDNVEIPREWFCIRRTGHPDFEETMVSYNCVPVAQDQSA